MFKHLKLVLLVLSHYARIIFQTIRQRKKEGKFLWQNQSWQKKANSLNCHMKHGTHLEISRISVELRQRLQVELAKHSEQSSSGQQYAGSSTTPRGAMWGCVRLCGVWANVSHRFSTQGRECRHQPSVRQTSQLNCIIQIYTSFIGNLLLSKLCKFNHDK